MIILSALLISSLLQTPIKVELKETTSGWQLLRGGKPYFVKGVGGATRMDDLVKAGGNSVRTWGTDKAATELLACQEKGLTLMLGIWLGHKEYFNYADPAQVQKQYEMVKEEVLRFRNSPALLTYGLGNEMENGNDTPEVWKSIEALCKLVKSLDPNHPVSTVIADFAPEKIANIKKYCPSLDILGINSYGGLMSMPDRLRAAGWTKPYIVTEFGPKGPWESEKTAWGAAVEPTSTQKAIKYASDYQHSIVGQPGFCLGSYAFLWGDKQEETPTWFGMWLASGERTAAVNVMEEAWSGKTPKNRAPVIESTSFNSAGSAYVASVKASDPDGDPLTYHWQLRYEVSEKKHDGEGEKIPDPVAGSIDGNHGPKISFVQPKIKAAFRVYVTITDGKGNAATANFPFKVE